MTTAAKTCIFPLILVVILQNALVFGALEGPLPQDGEKRVPFSLGHLFAWRASDSQTPAQFEAPPAAVVMNSPPKAMRLPIPVIQVAFIPREQEQQEQQQAPQKADQYDQPQEQTQPREFDYYDAVREEERQRQLHTELAESTQPNSRARAMAASIMATSGASGNMPEIPFAPRTIFIDPPVDERFLSGGHVVAAMLPDGQGGFTPLDEVVTTGSNGGRFTRFSAPQLTPSEDVLFVVDRNSGVMSSAFPAEHSTQLNAALSANFTPVAADEMPQSAEHPLPVEIIPAGAFEPVFVMHPQMEDPSTTDAQMQQDYDDEAKMKGMLEAKMAMRKKVKPFYAAVDDAPNVQSELPKQDPEANTNSEDVLSTVTQRKSANFEENSQSETALKPEEMSESESITAESITVAAETEQSSSEPIASETSETSEFPTSGSSASPTEMTEESKDTTTAKPVVKETGAWNVAGVVDSDVVYDDENRPAKDVVTVSESTTEQTSAPEAAEETPAPVTEETPEPAAQAKSTTNQGDASVIKDSTAEIVTTILDIEAVQAATTSASVLETSSSPDLGRVELELRERVPSDLPRPAIATRFLLGPRRMI